MSKFAKILAVLALIVGALVMTPGSAQARWGHGGHFHGGWGGGWGPGWGWGGYPYPYYGYAAPYYGPGCGYVRVWRRGHWVLRRNWRCY